MITTKKPYRVLLQINDDGTLGYSVIFKLVTTDESGVVLSSTELPMKDIDAEGGEWDLNSILGEALAASLVTIKQLNKQINDLAITPPAPEIATNSASKKSVLRAINAFSSEAFDSVLQYIGTLDTDSKIVYNESHTFHRDNELIKAAIAAGLFTPEQADAIFAAAIQLDNNG